MSSNQIIPYEKKLSNLRSFLAQNKTEVAKALPRHLDPERMFRLYLTCCNLTPRLAECDQFSVLGAVMQAAQLGLSLETVLGEAFMIPRENRRMNVWLAHFQIGYKGLRKLAKMADNELRDIWGETVYTKDAFDYQKGLQPSLMHKPLLKDRGDPMASYAVAEWKDGYKRFEVADEDRINRAKQSSDSYKRAIAQGNDYSPWIQHADAMYRKTSLIELCGQLPLGSDAMVARVLQADDSDGRQLLTEIRGVELPDLSVSAASSEGNGAGNGAAPAPPAPKSALDRVVEQAQAQPVQPPPAEPAPAPRKRRAPQQQAQQTLVPEPTAPPPEEPYDGPPDSRPGEVREPGQEG